MTSLAYDKEELRKVVINTLLKNEIIFDNWAIGEIASGIKNLNISKYETHLSKVFDLTLKALKQTTSVEIVQKGGGFPIKVLIFSIIFGMFYGFLNHEITNQIELGLTDIETEIIKTSKAVGEFKAVHTSLVLKKLPENVMSGGCNYYDTNTATFIKNKPKNLEVKLIDDGKKAIQHISNVENAIQKYQPKRLSDYKGQDLTDFANVFECQSHNIARAIKKDAELFATRMIEEITQDTKETSLKEKILSGFGLFANPTDTATTMIGNVGFTMEQGQRRFAIQKKQYDILNNRFQILVSNINNILKNRALNIRNLNVAKTFTSAISLAGVKYLAPGVPIGEFTVSGITQKLASGITYEGLNLLEDINDGDDKKGGKKRKTKRNRKKKNKKKTKKAKKSKKKKNKKSKKTKKARKKRR